MTSHRALPKFHVHPILLLFIIIAFLTGTFIQLLIILTIVFIHELGHYFMARKFYWHVSEIMIWVFGGVMKTEGNGNPPLIEKALVILAGPFQHVIIFLLLKGLQMMQWFPNSLIEMSLFYNQIIFFFNLLPVWPLDGGKLLFILMAYFLPYRKSYHTVILFSFVSCMLSIFILFFFFPFQLSTLLLLIFLSLENHSEWKNRFYFFMRFLLNRYEERRVYRDVQPIIATYQMNLMEVFTQFYREKNHMIYLKDCKQHPYILHEKDCLYYFFEEKKHQDPIGKLMKG